MEPGGEKQPCNSATGTGRQFGAALPSKHNVGIKPRKIKGFPMVLWPLTPG